MQPTHRLQRPIFPSALAAALLFSAASTAQVPVAISPANQSTFEGSSSTQLPLGRHDARFQTIHDLGNTAPLTITGIAYRRDATGTSGSVGAFDTIMEVRLAEAAFAPSNASPTFANNVGNNPTTVLNQTRIAFPAVLRPNDAPAPAFEFFIPFGQTFTLPPNTPLLVDLTIFGNTRPGGQVDANFSVHLDAHEQPANGDESVSGYRFGLGCAAPGTTRLHTARFEMVRDLLGDLTLDIDSRDGIPNLGSGTPMTAMIASMTNAPFAWPGNPSCIFEPRIDLSLTLGTNDGMGDWTGTLSTIPNLAPGYQFTAQIVSAWPGGGPDQLTVSDPSTITVPANRTQAPSAVRISSSSDRTAASGTISTTVPVTMFF